MNIYEHLTKINEEQLKSLKDEVIKILELNLNAQTQPENILIDTKEVIEVLSQAELNDAIITGVLHLVKIEKAGYNSYLKESSFYPEWKTNGYILAIEKTVKLPY